MAILSDIADNEYDSSPEGSQYGVNVNVRAIPISPRSAPGASSSYFIGSPWNHHPPFSAPITTRCNRLSSQTPRMSSRDLEESFLSTYMPGYGPSAGSGASKSGADCGDDDFYSSGYEEEEGVFYFSDDESDDCDPVNDCRKLLRETVQVVWSVVPVLSTYFQACQRSAAVHDPSSTTSQIWDDVIVACGRFVQISHILECSLTRPPRTPPEAITSASSSSSSSPSSSLTPRPAFVNLCHRFIVVWAALGMRLLKARHLMDLNEETKEKLTKLHLMIKDAKFFLSIIAPGPPPMSVFREDPMGGGNPMSAERVTAASSNNVRHRDCCV